MEEFSMKLDCLFPDCNSQSFSQVCFVYKKGLNFTINHKTYLCDNCETIVHQSPNNRFCGQHIAYGNYSLVFNSKYSFATHTSDDKEEEFISSHESSIKEINAQIKNLKFRNFI